MVAIHGGQGHKTFKEFYADAKKKGLKKATWSKNKREYAIVDKEDREKAFKKNTRKEQYVGKKGRGEQAGLSDKDAAFKTHQKIKGSNAPFKHAGKIFTTDMVGDKPQREQIDTFVGAWKGGLIKGKPKLAKRGWK